MDPKSSRDFPTNPDPGSEEYLVHPDHLRQLVEGLPSPLVAISSAGELFPLNRAARESAWVTRTEESGIGPGRVSLSPQITADLFLESGEASPLASCELRVEVGGGERLFTFRKVRLKDPLEPADRAIGTLSEVIEAPGGTPAPREDEETSRAAIDNLTEFILRWKPDGTRTFVNRAYVEAFGGGSPDLVGTSFFPLISEEEREKIRRKVAGITPENPTATAEHEMELPDGRVRWQEWTDRGLFREDGSLVGYQSVGRDITDRKRAEAALRQSEERYEKAFAFSTSPITISKITDGTFVEVNAAFTELTGFTYEEAIGKTSVELGFMSAETRESFRREMEEYGRLDHVEVEVNTKFGPRAALLSGWVVELGSEPHFFVSAEDITARKRARKAVEARLAFEETVSFVARATGEHAWDRLQLGFDEALARIGQFLKVDGCGMNQVLHGGKAFRMTNLWRPEGIDGWPDRNGADLFDLFPYHSAAILEGREVVFHDCLDIPEEGSKERESLLQAGIKSAAHMPLLIEGEVVGDLWVETIQETMEWTPDQLQYLRLFGTILASALRRQRAEESARKAWEFTEMALDSQMDTFFVFDASTGRPVRWNRAFKEISGYSDEEIEQMVAPDSWYEGEDLAKARRAVGRILKEGLGTVELSLITKEGARIPTEYRVSALTDDVGEVTHLISVGRDVTQRKQAEEALRKNEERLNAIIDNIPAMTYTGSMNGRISFISENVWELTGYNSQELYDADPGFFLRRIHPDDREAVKGALGLLATRGKPLDVEFRFRKKNGDWIWVHDQATITFEEDGIHSHYGMVFDVTERRQAREALRKSEERYHALIENIPGVTWVSALDGQTDFISPNVEEIYGYSPKEIYEGGGDLWFGRIHPDDREAVEAKFKRLMQLREPFEVEYRIRRKDGEWIWLHDRATTRFKEGGTAYAYGVFSDITEKKRLENQVVEISDWERQRMGQELHDDLGQQLTGLAALSGSLRTRLASEGRPEETDAARIEEIARGAVLYTRNLARGLYPHDVTGRTLPEAIRSLGQTTEAVFGISCLVQVDGSFKEIREDEALHLFRICQESIHNAVKHGGAAKVSVSLEMRENSLSLHIEDDGQGFLPGSTPEGMGLSVMRCRADLLSARLGFDTSPGEGTRIHLTAPGLGRPEVTAGKGRSK